jgi:hypothetical protein
MKRHFDAISEDVLFHMTTFLSAQSLARVRTCDRFTHRASDTNLTRDDLLETMSYWRPNFPGKDLRWGPGGWQSPMCATGWKDFRFIFAWRTRPVLDDLEARMWWLNTARDFTQHLVVRLCVKLEDDFLELQLRTNAGEDISDDSVIWRTVRNPMQLLDAFMQDALPKIFKLTPYK